MYPGDALLKMTTAQQSFPLGGRERIHARTSRTLSARVPRDGTKRKKTRVAAREWIKYRRTDAREEEVIVVTVVVVAITIVLVPLSRPPRTRAARPFSLRSFRHA